MDILQSLAPPQAPLASRLDLYSFNLKVQCYSTGEGSDTPKIAYEISKSLNFVKDFRISPKISRFHLRFQDLAKIVKFQQRFQEFSKNV